MPIPDAVAPNDDYREMQAAEIAKAQAKTKAIIDTCNAFLSKQINCKSLCLACKEPCEELREWEALEKNDNQNPIPGGA